MYDWKALADKHVANATERAALWAGLGVEFQAMGVAVAVPTCPPTIRADQGDIVLIDHEYDVRWMGATPNAGRTIVLLSGRLYRPDESLCYAEIQAFVDWPVLSGFIGLYNIVSGAAMAGFQ